MTGEGSLIADRYRLVSRLGGGGMGVVWRGVDEQDERPVALKQVRLHGPGDPTDHARTLEGLRRESRIAAAAGGHPHVVTVHGLVEHEDEPWLVMDLVPGRDLRRVVTDDGVLTGERAAHLGAQLADALEHLHGRELVHGDVTPGNVLVTETDDVVLTDFGISRPLLSDTLVTVGSPRGVPTFLAPEVAEGTLPRASADVFGLGAVLLYAVRGQGPWGQGDERAVLGRALVGHPVVTPPAGAFGRLLGPMLRRRPRDRPTIHGCREALRRYEEGERLPRAFRGPRRGLRIGIAAAAVVAVVAGAVALGAAATRAPGVPSAVVGLAGDVQAQRRVDPCGMLDAAALRRFGATSLDPDYGNFSRCDVFVDLDGRSVQVTALFEVTRDPPTDGTVRTERDGFTVLNVAHEPGDCDRQIVLPGGLDLDISASVDTGEDPPLCPMADTTVGVALAALSSGAGSPGDGASGALPSRPAPFPPASLGRVDACALLSPAEVAAAGAGGSTPDIGFGRWRCHWGPAGAPGIDVQFDRDVRGPSSVGGRPTTVGGREANEISERSGECTVSVLQRRYAKPEGSPSAELVPVDIERARDPDPCRAARALAEAVTGRLPRAT